MRRLLFQVKLDVEPVTWGGKDADRRKELQEAIKKEVNGFNADYMKQKLDECDDIEVILNCFLGPGVRDKDIDNLAKIPIDTVFFSAKGDRGYANWESKITSLTVRKLRGLKNVLEIIVYGTTTK